MPDTQTPFRPIHFALRVPDGEVRIYVWKSLDEALVTLKSLVPNLRSYLTPEHVRGLAVQERDADRGDLSPDEFAALWFAKTVYDPNLCLPDTLAGMYDAEGAAKYAEELKAGKPSDNYAALSAWSRFVRTLVQDEEPPRTAIRETVVEEREPTPEAKLCKNCGILPNVDSFRHSPPNWLIHCPGCGAATDPREGYSLETALEAWNKGN